MNMLFYMTEELRLQMELSLQTSWPQNGEIIPDYPGEPNIGENINFQDSPQALPPLCKSY